MQPHCLSLVSLRHTTSRLTYPPLSPPWAFRQCHCREGRQVSALVMRVDTAQHQCSRPPAGVMAEWSVTVSTVTKSIGTIKYEHGNRQLLTAILQAASLTDLDGAEHLQYLMTSALLIFRRQPVPQYWSRTACRTSTSAKSSAVFPGDIHVRECDSVCA